MKVQVGFKMQNNKKAQVTTFMIIGIVILIILSTLMYIRNIVEKGEIEEGVRIIEEVPSELIPIRSFVENCIKVEIEEALEILGQHGGHIYLESFDSNIIDPTEGDALEFNPFFGYKIPYWYYLKSENTCTSGCMFGSNMPPLCKAGRGCIRDGKNSIEEQIERYINENLKDCLNEFESFKEQAIEVTSLGDVDTRTIIRDNDIVVYVNYPLTVKKGEATYDIKEYQSTINSDLAELYEIAYDITKYEVNNCFIDEHVRNYYSVYTGLGYNNLPPTDESTIATFQTRMWILPEVKNQLKTITLNAVRSIGIFNTSGLRWPTAQEDDPYYDLKQGLMDQLIFYPLRRYHDATVTLKYNPWWDPYLDIRPREGSVIMPTTIKGLGGIGALFQAITITKIYEFSYQYSFPVVVDIRKEDITGKEQLLRFAIEANIRANKCFKSGFDVIRSISIGQSNLCDKTEMLKNLSVDVKDESNNELLGEVDVSFYAGETCLLGTTNKDGELETKYPNAIGGMIVLEKDGYLTKYIHQNDFFDKIDTTLKPIRKKTVSLKIIDSKTFDAMTDESVKSKSQALAIRDNNLKSPNENDTIIIELNRFQASYQDGELENIAVFDGNKITPETVDLVPGEYNISIQLFLNKEDLKLPEEHDRICEKGAGITGQCIKTPVSPTCSPRGDSQKDFEEGDCYIEGYTCESINGAIKKNGPVKDAWRTICKIGLFTDLYCNNKACAADEEIIYPETPIPNIPNGGAVYNGWKIDDYEKLDSGNITLYLFRQITPTRHHHMNDLMKYQNNSEEHAYAIKPEIISNKE